MGLIDRNTGILGDLASLTGGSPSLGTASNAVGDSFGLARLVNGVPGQPGGPSLPSGAAMLPLSTYNPGPPLPLNQGIIPVPSLDDLARSPPFNMTDQQLAAIRTRAEHQALVSGIAGLALGPAIDYALGPVGVPDFIATLVGAGIDFHDGLNLANQLKKAPDDAVYKQLNDSMNQASHAQSIPPLWRAIP